MSANIRHSDEQEDVEPYADATPLTWLFGDSPKTKLIAAMLSEADKDINISEISRLSGVSRNTVYEHIDDLVKLNIVIKTREMNGGTLYQINTNNEIVRDIAKIEQKLVDQWYNDDITVKD